jgi:C1A family cysteine protease
MQHHKLKYKDKYPLNRDSIEILQTRIIYTIKPIMLPQNIDLRNKFPPVYDQLQIGSCTANALIAAYQFLIPKFYGSRLFLYYNSRALDKNENFDVGSTLSQGINALKKYGVCQESLWTYVDDNKKFKLKPLKNCYTNGLDHQVLTAMYLKQDLNTFKQCLVNNNPFIFGMLVYDSFESDMVATTGIVPMPKLNERCLGGHAVICTGYDDKKKYL